MLAIGVFHGRVDSVIAALDFQKQPAIIRDLITRVIVKDRRKVKVCGEFQLPSLTTDKLGYELTSREAENVIRHLESTLRFPAPKPRRERIIVQRDKLGRIIHSKPPALKVI